MKKKTLKLDEIRIDGGTQMRVAIDAGHVQDIAHAIRHGDKLPPGRVYFDGAAYWLSRGFHRYHGHRAANKSVMEVEVINGTVSDAILDAAGDNAEHNALKRTNDDKRKAVETLLAHDEWKNRSASWLAETCRVSVPFASEIKKGTVNVNSGTVQGRDGREIKTANIGRKPAADAPSRGMPPGPHSGGGRVIDETVGQPDPPKKAEPLKDAAGHVVKDAALVAIFEQAASFRSLAARIATLKTEFEELTKTPAGAWATRRQQQFNALVSNLHSEIRFATPHALCPYCGGRKCDRCKQTGWMPEETYKAVPADVKGAA